MLKTLWIPEDIHDTRPDSSELARYYENPHSPGHAEALYISAAGRGREEVLPISFKIRVMALLVRYLAQVYGRMGRSCVGLSGTLLGRRKGVHRRGFLLGKAVISLLSLGCFHLRI